ncbi:unnamed protein product [Tilletia controversa]|uniref:DUF1688-domain-containing protein n=1 Tax=Tilletia controversa TaxID=13291 RepID=A0A8X7MUI3_9BASI|nr:hypothetical protein CF328_g3408 [Tilletia controversa]KAE8247860.1 hypothetical protein A4X06_0g4140 [Tilletia controversa]CAD6897059.1 unnamed protein product [Tilletia controversa]CAD6972316.1 unnamed protein product [Tilletia controversa]CAD6985545.1 unnamed protein product [Tilletia controversa]
MTSTAAPSDKVAYLRSLPSIRARCQQVFDLASSSSDGLQYFEFHPEHEAEVVNFCASIIQRDYGSEYGAILAHGRARHFEVGGIPRITTLLSNWHASKPEPVPALEAARRLVDLFAVSVLLDAGAGTQWTYEEVSTGFRIGRSEGLALASLDMFKDGIFAGTEEEKAAGDDNESSAQGGGPHSASDRHKVTASGLKNLSADTMAISMQVHPKSNPMTGLEGRTGLLVKMGEVLASDGNGYFVGPKGGAGESNPERRRPGFLVDYLLAHPSTTKNATTGQPQIEIATLWQVLIHGLAPIWPASRTQVDGVSLGDVWPCVALKAQLESQKGGPLTDETEAFVPFHKLSQWLCYSLTEPIEQTIAATFVGGQYQTGLPEYRNGGLFVDLGVLKPRQSLYQAAENASDFGTSAPTSSRNAPETVPQHPTEDDGAAAAVVSTASARVPRLGPSSPAIVEWRAMTVVLLDRLAQGLNEKLGAKLSLQQVLEAASWKGGREIAKQLRPESGGPPIDIISDGTLF